jgi:hypothetical protein
LSTFRPLKAAAKGYLRPPWANKLEIVGGIPRYSKFVAFCTWRQLPMVNLWGFQPLKAAMPSCIWWGNASGARTSYSLGIRKEVENPTVSWGKQDLHPVDVPHLC